METPPDSEDEGIPKVKFPRFRLLDDDANINFEKGLIFITKKEVIDAVKTFAMVHKKNLVINQNDKKSVVVKCMANCSFQL